MRFTSSYRSFPWSHELQHPMPCDAACQHEHEILDRVAAYRAHKDRLRTRVCHGGLFAIRGLDTSDFETFRVLRHGTNRIGNSSRDAFLLPWPSPPSSGTGLAHVAAGSRLPKQISRDDHSSSFQQLLGKHPKGTQ